MTGEAAEGRRGAVHYSGRRRDLFGLLLRGYLMMVPTLGIYRFWVTTQKRRFYWHHTAIDGEPLEYTGTATQLLLGFLFAVAFFLPIYIGFFYLSTQAPDIAGTGYLGAGVLLWFMLGYAGYRARDFRLSRTLWRGIRFDQRGSAWLYALRRFLWSLLVLATAGLAYPFMAASLWRYRYRNSWYGDRRFDFSGSWKALAGPFYLTYFGLIVLGFVALAGVGASPSLTIDQGELPGWQAWLIIVGYGLAVIAGWQYYRARSVTRMLSTLRIGEARLAVHVRARSLFGQALAYGLAVALVAAVFAAFSATVVGSVLAAEISVTGIPNAEDLQRLLRSGWFDAAVIVLTYFGFLAALGACSELVLGYGFWRLVARDATVSGGDTLRSVSAAAEDRSIIGEGLADALNVGAY